MAFVIASRSPIPVKFHFSRLPPPDSTSKVAKCPNPSTIFKFTQFISLPTFVHCVSQYPLPTTSRDRKAFALPAGLGFMKRETLLSMFLFAVSSPFLASGSSAETVDLQGSFRTYEDEVNKFRIFVPEGWLVGAGKSNTIKSVTAFYPKEAASNSNVSITITGLGPDFTTLGSFGKVDAFAETLVTGLDRSWQSPPGVAAKLINSEATNGLYYIEYTLQNPGERQRHIFSAIGIASNGWYNRLYTVTGQFMDDEPQNYQSLIEKSVLSFRLI